MWCVLRPDWLNAFRRGRASITSRPKRVRSRTGTIGLRNVYVRRTLRIFPPYYAILLGLVLFLAFVRPDATMKGAFFRELPWCLTYTTNWVEPTTLLSITWSLAAEEQFYLVWPPIERFVPRHAWKVLLVLLIANQLINFRLADPVLRACFGFVHDDRKILEVTFTPILLGVVLAHLLDRESWYRRIAPRVGGSVKAVTAGGDVRIGVTNKDLKGGVNIRSSGGDITLSLPPDIKADVEMIVSDADDTDLAIRSEFGELTVSRKSGSQRATATLNGGGEKVVVRTSSGLIRLKKTPTS